MIRLFTLGGLTVRKDSGGDSVIALAHVKRNALLTYLAVDRAGGPHSRDTLLALFWPESDERRARDALNQLLQSLRRDLGEGVFETGNGNVIGPDQDVLWCDAVAFELLLDEGQEEEALALYRGALLEGFHLSGCLEFERWLEDERRRLERRAAAATWSLAEQALAEGRTVQAADWGRRSLTLSPDDESVLQRVIELLDRVGDRAGAIRAYEGFTKRLQEDYDATPAPETTELIAAVRSREEAHRGVRPSTPASAPLEKQPAAAAPESVTTQPRAPWRTRRRAVAAIMVLGAIAAVGAVVMRNGQGEEPTLDPARVLVDIFQNETGDPSLDALGRMAADRVTAGLTYTGFVDVVSLSTPLLSFEPVVADSAATERFGRLRALARANGTGTVVWGSYYLQGDSLRLLAHVTNAATGVELATIEPVHARVDAPAPAVEQLRDRGMTTLATLTDPRLARWARHASKPPTFEAYQAFVEAMEVFATVEWGGTAGPPFLRAAALDSTFTMPLLWAIIAYDYRGPVADSIAQELARRREQLAPLDRDLLDYSLARMSRDHWVALRAIQRVVEIAPNSEYLALAAQTAMRLNRPRQAIEFLMQGDPESGWLRSQPHYWMGLAQAYHALGEHREELEQVHRGQSQLPNPRNILWQEMVALAALGRTEELYARLEETPPRPTGYYMADLAGELRTHGHGGAATEMLRRAIEWFEDRSPEQQRDPHERWRLAAAFLDAGRLDEAQVVFEGLVEDGRRRQIYRAQAGLGVVAARQGDREDALRISRSLEQGDGSLNLSGGVRVESAYERAWSPSGPWGRVFSSHADSRLEPLWDYPPFEELMRPKG